MANRGGVLALPKVKVPIQAIRLNKKCQNRRSQRGKKKTKALTRKELDDLGKKLEGKRPKRYIMNHYTLNLPFSNVLRPRNVILIRKIE